MWQKLSEIFRSSLRIIAIISLIVLWSALSYFGISYGRNFFSGPSDTETAEEKEDCNVYGINLHGDVVTYNSNDAYNDQDKLQFDQTSADAINWHVRKAQANDNIKAILVEIDSGGGSPVAGEEMMRAFKQSKKPVVAFIRDGGLSAAYLAATGAQTIFASKFSDVGSIGVTMSYLQETEKNKKEGFTFVDLSSGKYKDSGSPAKALSADEKKLFMRDIKIAHDYFVKLVAENRNLDIAKVKELADGSTVTGEAALAAGLIDGIGLLPDVKDYLAKEIGSEVEICWGE